VIKFENSRRLFFKFSKAICWDLLAGLPSIVLITYGISMIHRPSAMIFLGLSFGAIYVKHEFDVARGKQ